MTKELTKEQIEALNSYKQITIVLDNEPINIDIMIVALIEKLNKKGFYTAYCCSGHDEDFYTHGYITFAENMDKQHKNDLINIVKNIKELYLEIDYQILIADGSMISLINSTQEEKYIAKELAKRKQQKMSEKEIISIRIHKFNYYINEYYKENESNIIENKVHTYLAFKALENSIDAYNRKEL